MPDIDVIANFESLEGIIKRCRDNHQVKVKEITLIKDMMNDPISDPADSADVENFDNIEGRAILDAVEQYNNDLPLRQVAIISGSYTQIDLTTIYADWNNNEFRIDNIQYPIQYADSYLDKNSYRQTTEAGTNKPILYFVSNGPTSQFGIWFIRPHVFDVGKNQTSIPKSHWEAVGNLAAAKVLRIASKRAGSFGDTAGNYQNKDLSGVRQRLLDDAKECEQVYKALIESEIPAFPVNWINWELEGQNGPLILHPYQSTYYFGRA